VRKVKELYFMVKHATECTNTKRFRYTAAIEEPRQPLPYYRVLVNLGFVFKKIGVRHKLPWQWVWPVPPKKQKMLWNWRSSCS